MNQELIFQIQLLQNQGQELQQNIEMIDQQLFELKKMDSFIDFIDNSNSNKTFSTIGQGVHISTTLNSKDLFVEVGKGVIVKKSAKETKQVIEFQLKSLIEARTPLLGQLEVCNATLRSLMSELENNPSK